MSVSLAARERIALDRNAVPRHVAIIMDGNRRWAREHGVPAIEGHRRGMIALRRVTRSASDLGIGALTVYGFSTENWNRDAREISLLFELCVYFARSELIELRQEQRSRPSHRRLGIAARRASAGTGGPAGPDGREHRAAAEPRRQLQLARRAGAGRARHRRATWLAGPSCLRPSTKR